MPFVHAINFLELYRPGGIQARKTHWPSRCWASSISFCLTPGIGLSPITWCPADVRFFTSPPRKRSVVIPIVNKYLDSLLTLVHGLLGLAFEIPVATMLLYWLGL